MQTIDVHLGANSYPIYMQQGLLDRAGQVLRAHVGARRICIVTDQNVRAHYADRLQRSLTEAGYETACLCVQPGEASKDIHALPALYEALVQHRLTRSDCIVALGGGVVGDLAGFLAATYLRGIDFVQMPTSLLAQIDSSVGGKVAVDLACGKNLVGSFYQPRAVLIDTQLLCTLPDRVFADGMGEVIKTACIKDAELFELLTACGDRAGAMAHMQQIVARCCAIKAGVVERDERDTGERMVLNFGHTLGHAIETVQHYGGYTHGEAVAIGMAQMQALCEKKGLAAPGTAQRIVALLERYGLPHTLQGIDIDAMKAATAVDKKRIGGRVNVVIVPEIGRSEVYPAGADFFEEVG